MANLTDEQKTEYKEHIFLGNSLYNEAKTAFRDGCLTIARQKLDKALEHYKSAGNIVSGKSDIGTQNALDGIKKCNDLLATIAEKNKHK